MGRPATGRKYVYRVSVPLDQELKDAYRDAADALGVDLATWVREWMIEGIPTMRAIKASVDSGGDGPLRAFMRSAVEQGQARVAEFEEERRPVTESA